MYILYTTIPFRHAKADILHTTIPYRQANVDEFYTTIPFRQEMQMKYIWHGHKIY